MSNTFDEYLASVHIPISEYEKADIVVKAQILQGFNQTGTAGVTTELIEVINKGFSEIVGNFQSLKTALIQPKTEQSTAVASRDEQPVSQHLQAPDVMVLIDYEYYNTHKTFDKYFSKLFNAFVEANGDIRYRLIKTKHDIRVKDGETVVFRTSRNDCSIRNLYLELYDCHYLCGDWLVKRSANGFNNFNYQTTDSPPGYK
mmetsp:Transcript_18904/g.17149  ORF Transcript_18904/g.17149 Transcript_18904/m.17149 type:complete len:201 (-) Transcript_18904:164-766(-)